jgi:anti-sigma B factor antagonist
VKDLNDALSSSGGRQVFILNLAGVTFLDSVAIGAVVNIYKKCRERDIELILCALQPKVVESLRLTRISTILPCYKTEEEALETCN